MTVHPEKDHSLDSVLIYRVLPYMAVVYLCFDYNKVKLCSHLGRWLALLSSYMQCHWRPESYSPAIVTRTH